MSSRLNWESFFGGVAVGGIAAWLLSRNGRSPALLPARRIWQQTLAKEIGELPAAVIVGKAGARWRELLHDRPFFTQPALRWHLEQSILPGLALYQVMKEETGDEALAKARTGLLFDENGRQKFAYLKPLTKIPFFFPVFRVALKRLMAQNFPYPGWEIDWIRDDEKAIAFNIKSCIYLKVLTAYGAPELTPIFCHSDDAAMEGFTGMVFERKGTLGRGNEVCDFCYRKVD